MAAACCSASSPASVVAALAETLPRRVRAGSLSLIYALAIAVFGGSTQFVIKWLLRATGNALAPGWYMLGAALLGLASMSLLKESAPVRQAGQRLGAALRTRFQLWM
jgi:MFS transporter, MHS family, citrate/tricarballylate:H+ symporter